MHSKKCFVMVIVSLLLTVFLLTLTAGAASSRAGRDIMGRINIDFAFEYSCSRISGELIQNQGILGINAIAARQNEYTEEQ